MRKAQQLCVVLLSCYQPHTESRYGGEVVVKTALPSILHHRVDRASVRCKVAVDDKHGDLAPSWRGLVSRVSRIGSYSRWLCRNLGLLHETSNDLRSSGPTS